mgnify:FL=1
MKNLKVLKILMMIVIIMGILFISSLKVNAVENVYETVEVAATYEEDKIIITTNNSSGKGGNGLSDMTQDEALDKYKSNGVTGSDELSRRSNMLVTALQAIGTVVAVIMLSIIAIKYMISSVEERADYKQTMIPYVIGAGTLLIVSNLLGLIYSIIQNLNV